jgi:hypothetical protein
VRRTYLIEQAVTVGKMQRLQILKSGKERYGCSDVMTISFQFVDELPLSGDYTIADGNVTFGHRQMILQDGDVQSHHAASCLE